MSDMWTERTFKTNLFKQFLMANYMVIAWLYLVVFLPPKIGGKK